MGENIIRLHLTSLNKSITHIKFVRHDNTLYNIPPHATYILRPVVAGAVCRCITKTLTVVEKVGLLLLDLLGRLLMVVDMQLKNVTRQQGKTVAHSREKRQLDESQK